MHTVELSEFIQKIGELAQTDDYIQTFEIYHCVEMKGISMAEL